MERVENPASGGLCRGLEEIVEGVEIEVNLVFGN